MKQYIISITAALASGLMAGQVCNAIPTSYDGTDIVARGEAVPPPLFGSSGRPQEEDLVDARRYSPRKLEEIDLSIYSKMLYAFRKCSIDWVRSWFPDEEELKMLTDSNPLTGDDTYFLRYSQDDQKRHPVAVSPGWINDNAQFARQSDPTASGPWWPWAALQGASGERALALNITDAVLAISGEELVFTNLTNKDDYWPIFQKSDSTPVLVWWKKPMPQSLASGIFQWYIIMSTEGSTPEDGSVSLGSLTLRGFEQEEPTSFSLMKEDVNAVYHLKDYQSFGGRKGEIQF